MLNILLFPALQYIQWRYAIGEDREALTKVNRKTTDEDQKSMDAVHGEPQGFSLAWCCCGKMLLFQHLMYPLQCSTTWHGTVRAWRLYLGLQVSLTTPVLVCCSL